MKELESDERHEKLLLKTARELSHSISLPQVATVSSTLPTALPGLSVNVNVNAWPASHVIATSQGMPLTGQFGGIYRMEPARITEMLLSVLLNRQ